MPRTEKYFIGPGLLSDIRQTITRVAGMPDRTSGAKTQVVHQEMPRQGGKAFRICTFTGSWSINATKTVTFKGVTTTPNTVAAVNLFFPLTSTATTTARDCAIAKDGTAWYLIDVRLYEKTDTFLTGVQISAELDTASCAITIGSTQSTASAKYLSLYP